VRAEYYQKRMQELGFRRRDRTAEGNSIALRKGSGAAGRSWWCRRISTRYFREGTDVTVKEKDAPFSRPASATIPAGCAAAVVADQGR